MSANAFLKNHHPVKALNLKNHNNICAKHRDLSYCYINYSLPDNFDITCLLEAFGVPDRSLLSKHQYKKVEKHPYIIM